MKITLVTTCLVFGTLLGSAVAWAGEDSDTDRSHPVAFLKDSAITTAIKVIERNANDIPAPADIPTVRPWTADFLLPSISHREPERP